MCVCARAWVPTDRRLPLSALLAGLPAWASLSLGPHVHSAAFLVSVTPRPPAPAPACILSGRSPRFQLFGQQLWLFVQRVRGVGSASSLTGALPTAFPSSSGPGLDPLHPAVPHAAGRASGAGGLLPCTPTPSAPCPGGAGPSQASREAPCTVLIINLPWCLCHVGFFLVPLCADINGG